MVFLVGNIRNDVGRSDLLCDEAFLVHPVDVLLPVLFCLGQEGGVRCLHEGEKGLAGLFLHGGGQGEVLSALVVEQDLQAGVGILLEVVKALRAGAQEAGEDLGLVFDGLVVCQEDSLVVVGDAVLVDEEVVDVEALFLQLGHLVVDQAADGGVDLAGGHGAHELKSDVDQIHVFGVLPVGLEHGVDQGLAEGCSGVADFFARHILGLLDILVRQGQDDIEGGLDDGADGFDVDALVGDGLDGVVLIIEADVRLACGYERDGVILVGGETEDLIQEGMMGLYRAIGDYQPNGGASFKSFANLCINRRIIDAVKSYERKKNDPLKNYIPLFSGEWEDPTLSPEEEVVGRETRREFMRAMSGALSDFEFRVMVMYMNGTSCAEICETTKKDVKSVDNAIQRGKKKLRNILTKEQ